MKFKVGQHVACVHAMTLWQVAISAFLNDVSEVPVLGSRYTIRGGKRCDGCNIEGYVLEEIKNPDNCEGHGCDFSRGEFHFPDWMFAPIVDTKAFDEEMKRLSDPTKWTEEDHKRLDEIEVKEPEKENV